MPPSSVDLSSLFHDPAILAAVVPPDTLFGLLKRSFDLPPLWAALVQREDGTQVVCPAGTTIDGRNVEEVMLTRTVPMHFDVRTTAPSADHFDCRAQVTITCQVRTERTELSAFRRTLAAAGQVTVDEVRTRLLPMIVAGINTFLSHHDAGDMVHEASADALQTSLDENLRGLLFEYGLAGGEVLSMSVESPGYAARQRRAAELDRAESEQVASARIARALQQARAQHVAHLADLLEQLQQLARQFPNADVPELIRSFDASQRAEIYESLWDRERTAITTDIVVVAGSQVAFYAVGDLACPQHTVQLASPLGPLRSVTSTTLPCGTSVLLIGTATGVHIVDVHTRTLRASFGPVAAGHEAVRGGFNSVAAAGHFLFGTHSELGLWRWPLDGPTGTQVWTIRTRGATAVRHVQCDERTLWLSIDDRAIACPLSDATAHDDPPHMVYHGAAATLSALTCTADWILAGTATGQVLRWTTADPQAPSVLFEGHCRAVESIVHLGIAGVQRVFFTDTSTAVQAQVLGDTFGCQYRAGGQTLRRVNVAADLVVATNETRDRLLCWPVADPAAKPTSVPVAQVLGNSIQDVCLLQARG